ncbi:hypothetical protein ASD62_01095 [Phycicoccus sp. Root563]|uniref:hypothetical protein n=1 Tax=Phycicoccus sp. Root563 TaxID=1736562 RepID=UPI0007027D0C|nr:hypothetical protein [Phycicoccus sp. Root563]KQZ88123.1 hypothetical protein ASD62_01095 [Phycicoccus sp. Root563]
MTRRRPRLLALRSAAALSVAVALCGLATSPSHALGLPEPVSTAVGGVTSTVKGATGGLGLPVPGATSTAPTGTGSPTSSAHPSSSGTGTAHGPSATSSGASGKGAGSSGGSAPADGAVVDSPAATVCLIPTGGSSPAVRVDLEAAGVDLSSPLVKQFPQALAPCPKGAVPAGDHVLSIDATVKGLLGACVRVTRQVVPVQTTLVVLDRDLIKELTAAGVPLQRLVVPCPRGAGAPPAGHTPSSGTPGHPAAGRTPGAASALPAGLAFTGTDPVPMALVGAGLLWLGVLLTRRARVALRTNAARG